MASTPNGNPNAGNGESTVALPNAGAPDVGTRRGRRNTLAAGTQVGRYVVRALLGAGGMGVVYRAHDPELDREIALKLVRIWPGRNDGATRDRLLREAQALAQLSHPNVVAVHDVGTHDRDVYMAMELVEGRTLKKWLAEEKPPLKRVIEALVDAGRGLAAAHRAGLIHRDFKPDNVIVGVDGRVRVVDFGLAKAAGMVAGGSESRSESSPPNVVEHESDTGEREADSSMGRLRTPLTMAGLMVGTPGYMAPEQYSGDDVSPATDQFAFCATLFVALHGTRPFPGTSPSEIRARVVEGRIDEPSKSTVPTRLRRIASRGLSVKPEQRYASMDALLAELTADPAASWRRGLWAFALLALGGLAMLVLMNRTATVDPCPSMDARLAGVWDPATKAAVRTAMLSTKHPAAASTFAAVEKLLDARSEAWVQLSQQTCRASQVRGEISKHVAALRMQCLDRRLGETASLAKLLAATRDTSTLERAVEAVIGLAGLESCQDDQALLARVPPPEKKEVRDGVDALRQRFDDVRALAHTGRFAEAVARANAITTDARGTGYPPVLAEALLIEATTRQEAGDISDVDALLREALSTAARGGDDTTFARAWLARLSALIEQAKFQEVIAFEDIAKLAVERAGNERELRADLLMRIGQRNYEQSRYAEARSQLEQVLAIQEKVLGAKHTVVGQLSNMIGNTHFMEGNLDEARRCYERTAAVYEGTFGPDHPKVATALHNLGSVLHQQGRLDEGRSYYERALAIEERARPESPTVGHILANLAILALHQGKPAVTRDYAARSLALAEKAYGPDHPAAADAIELIGQAAYYSKDYAEAITRFERAVSIAEKALGPDAERVATSLLGLGRSYLGLGKPEKALPILERTLRALDAQQEPDETERALACFALARALWDTRGDRRRALQLAGRARELLPADTLDTSARGDIEDWLARHR